MRDISPESPEARREHPEAHPHRRGLWGHVGPGSIPFETARRVLVGVYNDGFIHAGNIAYLTLLTLFPFFIVTAAAAQLFGQREENLAAIHTLMATLPPDVASMIEAATIEVLDARTGSLLWFGAIVGLWTVSSFVETIRDILRRAYGTDFDRPFWHYRLLGMALVMASVALLMIGFSAQLLLTAAEEVVTRYLPAAQPAFDRIGGTRFVPVIIMFVSSWMMFVSLTPEQYRGRRYPKWPGALFNTIWWYVALTLLPRALGWFGGYALTYGGLAGVIVALLFFWLIGFGIVLGAQLNAALANPPQPRLKDSMDVDQAAEVK